MSQTKEENIPKQRNVSSSKVSETQNTPSSKGNTSSESNQTLFMLILVFGGI